MKIRGDEIFFQRGLAKHLYLYFFIFLFAILLVLSLWYFFPYFSFTGHSVLSSHFRCVDSNRGLLSLSKNTSLYSAEFPESPSQVYFDRCSSDGRYLYSYQCAADAPEGYRTTKTFCSFGCADLACLSGNSLEGCFVSLDHLQALASTYSFNLSSFYGLKPVLQGERAQESLLLFDTSGNLISTIPLYLSSGSLSTTFSFDSRITSLALNLTTRIVPLAFSAAALGCKKSCAGLGSSFTAFEGKVCCTGLTPIKHVNAPQISGAVGITTTNITCSL